MLVFMTLSVFVPCLVIVSLHFIQHQQACMYKLEDEVKPVLRC